MKNEQTTTCRVDEYLSPANKIPESRRLIQQDVIEAKAVLQANHHAMEHGGDYNWPASDRAYRVMQRAHHHQPGEKGASTFRPNSLSRRPE